MPFVDWLNRRRASPSPLGRAGVGPGMYAYVRTAGDSLARFHLRVDADGNGLVLANATAAAQLRPSGVIMAKSLLEDRSVESIVKQLQQAFRGVSVEQARADIEAVRQLLDQLPRPGRHFPVLNWDDPALSPRVTHLGTPLSADVPLAPLDRLRPLLERLWQNGIPHVTFVATPSLDAAALVAAVERAGDLGMITGVRARASDLATGRLLDDLCRVGIDHVNVGYSSSQAERHDALSGVGDQAQAEGLFNRLRGCEVCAMAEVALTASTLPDIESTLARLAELGVENVGFCALASIEGVPEALAASVLASTAHRVQEAAELAEVRYLWYPPRRFRSDHTAAEQALAGPRTSGDTSIRVEPDGTTYAPRGPYRPAGNLLSSDWATITRGAVYAAYRQRIEADTRCSTCPGLVVCAADCPRDPAGWAE